MGLESCSTVAIQGKPSEGNPSGVVIINESDFDAATMTKAGEIKVAAKVEVAEEVTPVKVPKAVAPWATE